MIIDNYKSFKEVFNGLFKKYHPDNQETGNAELFIKYKNAYDEALKQGVADILPEATIGVTLDQAFFGATIDYNGVKIVIPPKFYRKHRNITFKDNDGNNHCVKIDVVSNNNDEILNYTGRYSELEVEKIIPVTFLDAVLGTEKTIDIFGEKIILKYKPYELFSHPIKWISNKGFWSKMNPLKRNTLIVRCIMKHINVDKEDKKILESMRKKYGIKN